MVLLTEEECKALYELISQLSGGNPENVFSWDGEDNLFRPLTMACLKLYLCAGQRVPNRFECFQ